MKRSVAIVLILVAVFLCACPSLAYAGGTFYYTSSPELMADAINAGAQTTGMVAPDADMGSVANFLRVSAGCLTCLGVLIPVAVGVITLRAAKKKEQQ
jgi:hypothetical protein